MSHSMPVKKLPSSHGRFITKCTNKRKAEKTKIFLIFLFFKPQIKKTQKTILCPLKGINREKYSTHFKNIVFEKTPFTSL